MTDIRTSRLRLHAVDVPEAERIVARAPIPADEWASDFPFEGDVVALRAFLQASARSGDQQPFGFYRISRLSDGRAIGGIGFKGPPDAGCVEIGYGLVPSARGRRLACEAVGGLVRVAAEHRVSRVVADTMVQNVASQRTLVRAGFAQVRTDAGLCHFELALEVGPAS